MPEAANLSVNYFELFGIDAAFTIPQAKLAASYRQLQQQVHPDKFSNASASEKRLSVQQSSQINQAYQTLRNPLERAKYLLEIHGVEMRAETATIHDPQFLMQQMDLREALAEIDQQADPQTAVLSIAQEVDTLVQGVYRELDALFPAPSGPLNEADLTQALDLVKRLQFLSKLQSDISDKEHQLV